MRWLVTGAAGMLGQDLVLRLQQAGEEVTPLSRAELDITDAAGVAEALAGHDVVVNTAAWTNVDSAEEHEPEAAHVNVTGPAVLAAECARIGARLVHISTDYVFDGSATTPYPGDAPTAPRSAYGRTKAAGEAEVLRALPGAGYIVRTAWLYGDGGPNFVKTMARLSTQREHLDVVDDQVGQPSWTVDVADSILALIAAEAPVGVYHATSTGEVTWHGLAQAVFTELGLDPSRVRPTTTDAFPRPAPRPAYSVLGHEMWAAASLPGLPEWRSSLHRAAPTVLGEWLGSAEAR